MTLYAPALDGGLNALHNNVTSIYLCNAEPSNYNDAVNTLALGNANPGAGGTVSPPNDALPNGRIVRTIEITNGQSIISGVAIAWALVDNVNQKLYASGLLSSSMSITVGNPFSLSSFSIALPAY